MHWQSKTWIPAFAGMTYSCKDDVFIVAYRHSRQLTPSFPRKRESMCPVERRYEMTVKQEIQTVERIDAHISVKAWPEKNKKTSAPLRLKKSPNDQLKTNQ